MDYIVIYESKFGREYQRVIAETMHEALQRFETVLAEDLDVQEIIEVVTRQ